MLDSADQRRPRAPCVSIILPTFNRLKFLAATIESIRRQSFTDWELLIADDGSGPELRAVLHELDDPPRIRVLWLAHTGNPPAVRNAALREAKGDYVAFVDSDDVWLPRKLELQMRSLRYPTTRDWSYTGFTLVDDGGKPLPGNRAISSQAIEGRIFEPLVHGQAVLVQSSVMVRRSLLEMVGGYDVGLPVCGDYELWMRLAHESEIACVGQSLVHVRRHGEHYADDVAALEDLALTLRKVQRTKLAPDLQHVLQRRRVGVSASLARRHALCGRPFGVLGTVLHDLPFSWRYPNWWLAVLASTARVLAPTAALNMIRAYRRRRSH